MVEKRCPVCGKVFDSCAPRQIYCSLKCKRRRYYLENHEKILDRQRKERDSHSDFYRKYNRIYYLAHRDELLDRQRDCHFNKLCEKLFGRRLT